MHRAFVRFITDGDAGWPAYDRDRRPAMEFDDPPRVVDDPLCLQRELFS
jgi:para-nitrobenzyl esterase